MAHRVTIKLPVNVTVDGGGKPLGTLTLENASLTWKPRGSRKSHVLRWAAFDQLMQAQGAAASPARKPASTRKRPRREPGALAPYFDAVRELRATYKGKTVKARVTADGYIRFKGKDYESPTAAASAIVKVGRRNGWNLWRFANDAGEWIAVATLRRK